MKIFNAWDEETCSFKDYICIESTAGDKGNGYFYNKWKEIEMEEVQVVRFLPGNNITYPEKRYIGTVNDEWCFKNPDNFQLKTDICKILKAELIQEPKFYLRGLIVFQSKEYVFTAMVDLNNFSEADYQKVVQVAYDKIRMGKYQVSVTQESMTPEKEET